MGNEYNGWANRETWLVNLHFGDEIQEVLQEMADDETITDDSSYTFIANEIEGFMDDLLTDSIDDISSISLFFADLIDLSEIDYYGLAKAYEGDLDYPEPEEEEEEEEEE